MSKAKQPARRPRKAAVASVRVRMYNTGFGDCFLLSFPCPGGTKKVLIDCGKHKLSKCEPGIKVIVKQLLQDLEEGEDAGPRVDVVVVTHRHQDHVSGFEVEGWDDVTVGEVWMPWTEDPQDTEGKHICDVQSRRALHLQQEIIPRLQVDEHQRAYLLGYAGNNMTNEAAMKRLHGGFKGVSRRCFFPRPDTPSMTGQTSPVRRLSDDLIDTSLLPGVEVYVLGPSRDPAVIRDMIPPAGEFYALGLQKDAESRSGEAPAVSADATPVAALSSPRSPFSPRWQLNTAAQYVEWYTSQKHGDPLAGFINRKTNKSTWSDFAKYVGRVADDPEMELAASLESAVNGTSLVLLFKIGRALLLFPGDAQWGTWNAIMSEDRWQHLLKSVSFYKVGHHGSENATPRRFVEEFLPSGALAMIPTDDVSSWPMIPKDTLLAGLAKRRVGFVRSDRLVTSDPKEFRRFEPDGYTLYVDVDIPC